MLFYSQTPRQRLGQYGFFETPEVGITGIFVLVKFENQLEILIGDIIFNSACC